MSAHRRPLARRPKKSTLLPLCLLVPSNFCACSECLWQGNRRSEIPRRTCQKRSMAGRETKQIPENPYRKVPQEIGHRKLLLFLGGVCFSWEVFSVLGPGGENLCRHFAWRPCLRHGWERVVTEGGGVRPGQAVLQHLQRNKSCRQGGSSGSGDLLAVQAHGENPAVSSS